MRSYLIFHWRIYEKGFFLGFISLQVYQSGLSFESVFCSVFSQKTEFPRERESRQNRKFQTGLV